MRVVHRKQEVSSATTLPFTWTELDASRSAQPALQPPAHHQGRESNLQPVDLCLLSSVQVSEIKFSLSAASIWVFSPVLSHLAHVMISCYPHPHRLTLWQDLVRGGRGWRSKGRTWVCRWRRLLTFRWLESAVTPSRHSISALRGQWVFICRPEHVREHVRGMFWLCLFVCVSAGLCATWPKLSSLTPQVVPWSSALVSAAPSIGLSPPRPTPS